MLRRLRNLRVSLAAKLILLVGGLLVCSMATWAYFNIDTQRKKLMDTVISSTDRLTATILLGTHYAMLHNSREDITQIINNIAKLPEIKNIRIYNKQGQIKFSNDPTETDRFTPIKGEACHICHKTKPPLSDLPLKQRTRMIPSPEGEPLLGIIAPIKNEPSCAVPDCHVHPEDKKILGALDVVVSLARTHAEIARSKRGILGLSAFIFFVTSAIIFIFLLRFVSHPIKQLISVTRQIAEGEHFDDIAIKHDDEMGQLARAINAMGHNILKKQAELNQQRDEYQNLFEQVPCLITVQDKNYKLLRYNRQFAQRFNPHAGEYCYQAYKGRTHKCDPCPVEKTFLDGKQHSTEEFAVDPDGRMKRWIVKTSPIRNDKGEIIAAMEISHDITEIKLLEVELKRSEEKYRAFFNNIPNPVFVLEAETTRILDCNQSVQTVYGYTPRELIGRSFLLLFPEKEKSYYASKMAGSDTLDRVKQTHKSGKPLYVNIRISPSTISGKKVYLVTTSDITQRLEAEQQLIQAGKMATLGEMATGIAHELNQPLSVIKTTSSFFMDKIQKNEPINTQILSSMLAKVDSNVDRATRIINHMRQFARKSELQLERTQLNDVIRNALEIFSQQLKVRGIEIVLNLDPALPAILADPGRLEQVVINLLVNARDAIEEKWNRRGRRQESEKIELVTRFQQDQVVLEVRDSGTGIPEAFLDKVFEPFFTTKEVGKGTGLGLSISYGIVTESGGQIEATNVEGNGACFILRFPVIKVETSRPDPKHTQSIKG